MTEDHFNWPNASRSNTMYLSTIKSQEPGLARKTFYTNKSPNLDITDIDKARPYYQGYQYNQKEIYNNRNDDIAGSRPKKLHQPLEKIYYNLRNDDIHGSKPQCQKFTTTRTPINPLAPEYKIPQVEVRVATPPKFIRDQIDIKDIDGARPNPYIRYDIKTKTNNVEDIDGAKPKKEWVPQGKQSSLNVKDINSFWEFHTKRQTDPLSPRYKVVNDNNELYEYGKLDNKVAVRHPKEVNKVVSSDLRTEDVPGAKASTATQHLTKIETRATYIQTKDIPGAQPGTLKKGMATARQLDPLWPVYTVPGHSEPLPVYTKNVKPVYQKYENDSQFASKSNFAATGGMPKSAENGPKSEIFDTNQGEAIRRPSDTKTISSQASQGEKRVVTPLMRSGEEVLNRGDYVPSKTNGKANNENVNNAKRTTGGMNFEAKKALNSNEVYQNNVKGFFGIGGADENTNSKPRSKAEKFDKFISK